MNATYIMYKISFEMRLKGDTGIGIINQIQNHFSTDDWEENY